MVFTFHQLPIRLTITLTCSNYTTIDSNIEMSHMDIV